MAPMTRVLALCAALASLGTGSTVGGQTISTFAGQDTTPGFGGDGLAATNALINRPGAIAVDAVGNVYFADKVSGAAGAACLPLVAAGVPPSLPLAAHAQSGTRIARASSR